MLNLMTGFVLGVIILIPLSIKWELEKRIAIPASCLIGLLSGFITNGLPGLRDERYATIVLIQILIIVVVSTTLLLWRFFRDPERIPPEGDNIILSPADGKIVYVKKIEKGQIPFSEKKEKTYSLEEFIQADVLPHGGTLIGIEMTYLDVHINRAPLSGRISMLKHIKGNFISLKKDEAVTQNERALMILDNHNIRLGIVLIASRLVRKIVSYVQEKQEVVKGMKIGMIRFGSQVDLILPEHSFINIEVKKGDKVKAGLTILARINEE